VRPGELSVRWAFATARTLIEGFRLCGSDFARGWELSVQADEEAASNPSSRTTVAPSDGRSPFRRLVLMRVALIPAQLVFVLWILYIAIVVPTSLSSLTATSFFTGFGTMVANIFTGNWGFASNTVFQMPWFELYVDFLPTSLQIALFALPLTAVLAYYLGLAVGWNSRPVTDVPARVTSLAAGLIPVFVVGLLVEFGLAIAFFDYFHDFPGYGIIPSPSWFNTYYGGFPSWVIDGWITKPTGVPLVDGALHHAWSFEAITLAKTLIQAVVVAIVYVAVFLRHARALVASAKAELHIQAARSRGIPESTLLWKHTARRVAPGFLVLFALTIPAYLATQFVVEGVFNDPGVGFLTLTLLSQGGDLTALEGMIFLLSGFVLVSILIVDLFAARADPRSEVRR